MAERLYVVRASKADGGCATTFGVRDPGSGRFVLVKVAKGADEDDVSALRREFQLQRRAWELDGRFPRPYSFVESLRATGQDCAMARGRAAILMERVNGPTLRNLIERGRYLDEPVAARVARDLLEQELVLAGLGYCHHDPSPSNVILDVGTERCCARLIDLGVACSLSRDDGVRLRGPFQRPDEATRPLGTPPSPLGDLFGTALVIREACWGDLIAAGREIPETPLSRWVGRVLRDGFPSPSDALGALPS